MKLSEEVAQLRQQVQDLESSTLTADQLRDNIIILVGQVQRLCEAVEGLYLYVKMRDLNPDVKGGPFDGTH